MDTGNVRGISGAPICRGTIQFANPRKQSMVIASQTMAPLVDTSNVLGTWQGCQSLDVLREHTSTRDTTDQQTSTRDTTDQHTSTRGTTTDQQTSTRDTTIDQQYYY